MIETLKPDDFLASSHEGVIVDVRTPAEFEKGHIPGAINIPLFSNEERVVVGTIYIKKGKEPAVEKGLEFVGARLAQLVKDAKKASQGKPIYLYCWRGGMRSGSVGWLFSTAGLEVKLLKGGYKAFRRNFETLIQNNDWRFIMLGGSTGCGKTELLHKLKAQGEQIIDLEALASHKGSAFGGLGMVKQPTTEHFINILNMYMRELDPKRRVWCESESMLIGHVFLPPSFYQLMSRSAQIEVTMDQEQRLDRLCVEYGKFDIDMLKEAFTKIRKRLGFDQTKMALEALDNNDVREAARLALNYYDKAYKQSSDKKERLWRKSFQVDNNDMQKSTEELIKMIK